MPQSRASLLEETEDGSMHMGRAGFRLTAAMPKNNPRSLDRSTSSSLEMSREGEPGLLRHNSSSLTLVDADTSLHGVDAAGSRLAGLGLRAGGAALAAKATTDEQVQQGECSTRPSPSLLCWVVENASSSCGVIYRMMVERVGTASDRGARV